MGQSIVSCRFSLKPIHFYVKYPQLWILNYICLAWPSAEVYHCATAATKHLRPCALFDPSCIVIGATQGPLTQKVAATGRGRFCDKNPLVSCYIAIENGP